MSISQGFIYIVHISDFDILHARYTIYYRSNFIDISNITDIYT